MTSQAVPEDTKEFKDLVRQRGSIKGRLTIFANYLKGLEEFGTNKIPISSIQELSLRTEKIESLFSDYDKCQLKIEVLCSLIDEQIKEREITENIFYTSISAAQSLLQAHPKATLEVTDCASVASCSNVNMQVKLPIIKLPTFDGNYFMWLEYRDTFQSLIHNNESVPEINKFHYLRSSLEGSASLVIKAIEFTSTNYRIAWDLLCQRYDNKNILIYNHLKALFKIDPLTRESHKSLRYIIDLVTKNLRALKTLDLPVDSWDILIIFMVSTKLDPVTSMKWEEYRNDLDDLPRFSQFIEFLRNRADLLETALANKSDRHEQNINFRYHHKNDNKNSLTHNNKYTNSLQNNNHKFAKSFVTSATTSKPTGPLSCPLCGKTHRIIDCESFKNLTLDKRWNEVRKLNLCSNCLRRGHDMSVCYIGPCRLCNEKHNTILHKDKNSHTNSSPVTLSLRTAGQVLLGTALVEVTNPENEATYRARALLDAGSQSSFVTHNLKHKLKINSHKLDYVTISGINNVQVPIADRCNVFINSLTDSFNFDLNCFVVPEITSKLPNTFVNISSLNLPDDLQYADPNFNIPSNIDLLLGAEVFFDILCPQKISLGRNMPTLQSTKLGWVVAGPLGLDGSQPPKSIHCHFTREINENLTKFWNLEEVPSSNSIMTTDEEFCEEHFLKHTTRKSDGRFSVSMPIRDNPETALGESYKMATKRYFNLEKRLNKNPELKKQYINFIQEYDSLGHLTRIDKPKFGYYLPHHAVIRECSETTKLRVVFDASAKTTNKKSLNDIQCVGPVVQDDLFNILIRFRQHKFVLTGDIQKMYRQILINESQRQLQLIVWRDDESKPLEVLQLNTVTYGTASAPFLSTRCLLQLALECSNQDISEIIKQDIYMDDLLTGADYEDDLKRILEEVTRELHSGGFPLHKFRSNCPQIFEDSTLTNSLDLSNQASVLGVQWTPNTDTLSFSIKLDTLNDKITKRLILSNTCKIFDPLGLLSPCTVTLKILLQKLWQLKLSWDEQVPNDIKKVWLKMIGSLDDLLSLSVPRHVMCLSPVKIEIHCFVDASQQAYAACVYMRTVSNTKNINIKLICAKTRVAPLKAVTIPRLELCAALLGARLVAKVSESFRCPIHTKKFWSDSTITLGWIKTHPKTLKTFVCNRINEIHELTERTSWRHIPTDINPADMASRGVEPKCVLNSSLWWEGPDFLKKPESQWPQSPNPETNLPEIKSLKTTIAEKEHKIIKFENWSNSSKLKRIFAYIIRFINNCKNNSNKTKGQLTQRELDQSLTYLLKLAQNECFSHEITLINRKHKLTSSSLLQLSPFLDDRGVLRVGGRLDNTNFNFEKKHPILLDAKHHFTKLLMRAEHLRLLHAGPQLLLSSFRDQFWPLGGRTLARKIVRQCVTCTRHRGKTMEPLMGQLPSTRVTQSFPFQICGTDFAGPFYISSKKGRGNRISKCYLCLFICFCTKALHLEIVSDLSSNAFIASLRRFISRRGKPNQIYCDNGTNFIGANNELNKVVQLNLRAMQDFTAEEGIKFNFNPPYSPTLGGLWEAGVKSAKFHLKRVLGDLSLTYEELSTLCTQIEAVLNSRPLTPLTSDPNDLSPLTPGHFLIGRPLTSLPAAPNITERKIKTRYQMLESLRVHFWRRWHNEYLSELQQKTKWRIPYENIKNDALVIFKDKTLPPMKWKLGRVIKLYPGKDGVCRIADFRTQRGVERRALNKVCPLLQGDDDVSDEPLTKAPVAAAASSSAPAEEAPRCLRQPRGRRGVKGKRGARARAGRGASTSH
ncbi:uncharacterized protein LOC126366187 [Pectinophora gossypiella]|uniref:uncharacterized protein LOC126366187 n=1 Tax=Pectinophora gossypiella TaxID=13191 RepID=UPI00214E5E6C|nr:uncharacterized protein LOC126366187 [Pectinophora gossypiella]